MSDSPESVVRKFLAAFADPRLVELVSFFNGDAVWKEGPRGIRRGAEAIKSELEVQLATGLSVTIDVKSLVADGQTVMVERVDSFTIDHKSFFLDVMAVFEIDADGRIKQWRESFDQKSVTDQMEAAGLDLAELARRGGTRRPD